MVPEQRVRNRKVRNPCWQSILHSKGTDGLELRAAWKEAQDLPVFSGDAMAIGDTEPSTRPRTSVTNRCFA